MRHRETGMCEAGRNPLGLALLLMMKFTSRNRGKTGPNGIRPILISRQLGYKVVTVWSVIFERGLAQD